MSEPTDEYAALAQRLREACGAAVLAFLEQQYAEPAERLEQLRRAVEQARRDCRPRT
jgi:hypothetical protein